MWEIWLPWDSHAVCNPNILKTLEDEKYVEVLIIGVKKLSWKEIFQL